MEVSYGKTFERPAPGMYIATVVDVVDMPNVTTQYGLKNKVRFHWVLATMDGRLVVGKDNQPIEAIAMWNATLAPRSDLGKNLPLILGGPVPVITGADGTEQIAQLSIGRSNFLVLTPSPNIKNPQDPYINVTAIGPVPPGAATPSVPPNYVRHKNRPKTQAGPQGVPVQTYSHPPAQSGGSVPAPAYPSWPQPMVASSTAVQSTTAPSNTVTLSNPPAAVPGTAPALKSF